MALVCPREAVTNVAVRIDSGPWLLNGELAYAEGSAPIAAAVLAGPHPLLGGTMGNNVVRALGDGLAWRGVVTLRFDYRGSGDNEGPAADLVARLSQFWETSQIEEEADYQKDLVSAVAFLRSAVGA